MSHSTNTKNNAGKRLFDWLDERYKFSPLIDYMSHKEVPIHRHTVWYYMGGVSLFLFIVQVVTGILLVLYYRPGAEEAFESVRSGHVRRDQVVQVALHGRGIQAEQVVGYRGISQQRAESAVGS